MHRIEKITVIGFRGQKRPIELNLAPDANFIIGRNGTGKTTLINIINAALSIDLPTLRESRFDRIEFTFKRARGRLKPRVVVHRSILDDGSSDITYKVAESATAELDEYKFTRMRRKNSPSLEYVALDRGRRISNSLLRERLALVFKTTWLSLQRGADILAPDDEWDGDSRPDIDRKLDRLSNDLTKYFSRLDRTVSDKTQQFQKDWFLSFLASDRAIKEKDISRIDIDAERQALSSIFNDFEMRPETFVRQLERHFRLVERAKSSFSNGPRVPEKDYLIAFDFLRLHSLVEQWQVLEKDKEEVYQPKEQFQNIASEMLYKKQIFTNRSNEVVIADPDYLTIPMDKLSSGEKQLLIFLSETLLQEQKPYIFLADEPELSMHVEWQEELVPAILKINPNAQVLFATHSPDIVNIFQNNVLRMEDLVD